MGRSNPCGDLDQMSFVGRYGGRNHVCNISWLSVKGCKCGERGKFAFSHWLDASPLQHWSHYRVTVWWRSLKPVPFESLVAVSYSPSIHSNSGFILHHLRDKARYWSKIVIFSYPLAFDAPVRGYPCSFPAPNGMAIVRRGWGVVKWINSPI